MASADDDSEENNEKMESLFSTESDKILLPIYQVSIINKAGCLEMACFLSGSPDVRRNVVATAFHAGSMDINIYFL